MDDTSRDDVPNDADGDFPPPPSDSEPDNADPGQVLIPDRSDHLRLLGGTFPGRSDRDIDAHLIDIVQLEDDDFSLTSVVPDGLSE